MSEVRSQGLTWESEQMLCLHHSSEQAEWGKVMSGIKTREGEFYVDKFSQIL
jgi:hypothetical protein